MSRRGRSEEKGEDAESTDRHRLFTAMIYGRQQDPTTTSTTTSDRNLGAASSSSPESNVPSRQAASLKETTPQGNDHDVDKLNASLKNRIDGALDQIDKQIPHDPIALRQNSLYQGSLQMLQWQRDNYLVGKEYADWRKNDRHRTQQRQQQQQQQQVFSRMTTTTAVAETSYDIPYDPTALGHPQLAKLASDFIPTETVVKALTPIVAGLPATVLYEPVRNSAVEIVRGQQGNLEGIIKNQLLRFLDNPQNREAMKNSTRGMLIRRTNTAKDMGEQRRSNTNTTS